MADNNQLAKRIWDIFTEPTPPQRKTYRENVAAGKDAGDAILIFSAFVTEHMQRVKQYVNKWNGMVLANGRSEEELLNAVLDDFESMRGKENPDLLYFALEVFLTHHKGTETIAIPSLLAREPELTAPSKKTDDGINLEVALGSEAETKLDWFREDPLLNEHHAHWHVVYDKSQVYDRQGEMFLYMHQQMLARYDAERISADVDRVVPFSDFTKPIQVGYIAGPDERISEAFMNDRPVKLKVSAARAQQHKADRKALMNDIANGKYDPDTSTADELLQETDAINTLGSTMEQNESPQSDWSVSYKNYHGMGHVATGELNNGVMFDPQVAVRDVIFWEWHKEVDTHYTKFQERFEPYDFTADAPPVIIRKGSDDDGNSQSMDVILCFTKDIPGADKPGFDGKAFGERAFGGDNWNKDFLAATASYKDPQGNKKTVETTDTLVTMMNYANMQYKLNGQQQQYDYSYLNHEPFCYFIRVQNNSHEQRQVTVRIFIAPESHENDRTMWIEMDKFFYELMPDSKTVIFRNDTESSVIRKPAVKDPSTYNINFNPTDIRLDRAQCKCGWPYHLLVPKGKATEEGSAYKMVVMISDASIDSTETQPDCGSLSFCGARDSMYPDKRPMGYPFNRKFKKDILKTVSSFDNFASRSFKILHTL
jgi:tyrosinase